MAKNKKRLLQFGALLSATSPIVAVVSCGNGENPEPIVGGFDKENVPSIFEMQNDGSFLAHINYGASIDLEEFVNSLKKTFNLTSGDALSGAWKDGNQINTNKPGEYNYTLTFTRGEQKIIKIFKLIVNEYNDVEKPTFALVDSSRLTKVNDYEYTVSEHIEQGAAGMTGSKLIGVVKGLFAFHDNFTSDEDITLETAWLNNKEFNSDIQGTYTLLLTGKDQAKNSTTLRVNLIVDAPAVIGTPPVANVNDAERENVYPDRGAMLNDVSDPSSPVSKAFAPMSLDTSMTNEEKIKILMQKLVDKLPSYATLLSVQQKGDSSTYDASINEKQLMENKLSILDLIQIIESKGEGKANLFSFTDVESSSEDITISGSWGSTGKPTSGAVGKYTYILTGTDEDGNSTNVTINLKLNMDIDISGTTWADSVFKQIKTFLENDPNAGKANLIKLDIPDANDINIGDFYFKMQGGKWQSSLTNTVITAWQLFKVNFTLATDEELEKAIQDYSANGMWTDNKAWIHQHYRGTLDDWIVVLKKAINKMILLGVTDLNNSIIRLIQQKQWDGHNFNTYFNTNKDDPTKINILSEYKN